MSTFSSVGRLASTHAPQLSQFKDISDSQYEGCGHKFHIAEFGAGVCIGRMLA